MAKTRAELLESASRRHIEVSGVRLQSLTELERSSLQSMWSERYEKTKKINIALSRAELLVASIVDPLGAPMFTSADYPIFGSLDAKSVDVWYLAARKHSGFDEDDQVDLEKKSDETVA